MKKNDVEKLLTSFKRIQPRADFVRDSIARITILPQHTASQASFDEAYQRFSLVARMRDVFRITSFVGAGVVVLLVAYFATKELSPLVLPGLNYAKVVAEAEQVQGTIKEQVPELSYAIAANNEGQQALKQVTAEVPNYLNNLVIQKEANQLSGALEANRYQQVQTQNQEANNLLKLISE